MPTNLVTVVPTFTYNDGSHPFPYNSGVFLCSQKADGTGPYYNGVLLQYRWNNDRTFGRVNDITLPVLMGRQGAALEVGSALFNSAAITYMFNRYDYGFENNNNTILECLQGLESDMYAGYTIHYYDSVVKGDLTNTHWVGGLVVTPQSYTALTQPAGWIGYTASFYEVKQ